MSQNESWWSIGEEDIPICRARLTRFVWLSLGFTPDTCHLRRSVPRCPACLMEMQWFLLLSLWVHGGDAFDCFTLMFWPWQRPLWEWFQDMAAGAQIVTGSFLQSEFLQWWIQLPCVLFVALCYCVIHVSHVSRPKQQFTVENRHPCSALSSSWGRWPHRGEERVSRVPFITSYFIVYGAWLLPSLLFQPIQSSLLFTAYLNSDRIQRTVSSSFRCLSYIWKTLKYTTFCQIF